MTEWSDSVAAAAKGRGIRIAVAESLTCGLLASGVGKGEGAQDWFAGAVVAYQTDIKESVLGVPPGTDPVSTDCAEQLARGVRELLHCDIGVSTTGVGGPGAEDGHPAGTVYLGWATEEGTGHRRFAFSGSPERILEQTVDAALALLAELTGAR